MTDLIERDNRIEAKAGVYNFGRRLFSILFVSTFIGLIVLSYTYDNLDGVKTLFYSLLWAAVFWFFGYKLADYRVQHIETIKYYKQQQSNEDSKV